MKSPIKENRADAIRARFRPRVLQRTSDPDEGRKKYEDKQFDEWSASADDAPEDGESCYRDGDGDSESGPTIVGLMKGPKQKVASEELSGFVLNQLPRGLVSDIPGDTRRWWVPFERVGLGEIWEKNVRDDSTPDEYTGGTHRISWRGSGRGFRINPKAIHAKTCEMCNAEFKGTKGARYCNECRSPKYCKMRRDALIAEGKALPEPSPKPFGGDAWQTCQRCAVEFLARRGTRYCTANCRKRAHEENMIVR